MGYTMRRIGSTWLRVPRGGCCSCCCRRIGEYYDSNRVACGLDEAVEDDRKETVLQAHLDLAHGALELAVPGGGDGPGAAGEFQQLAGGEKRWRRRTTASSSRPSTSASPASANGSGRGGAVAIGGEIFREPFLESIGEDSEVFFLLRIEAG